MTSWKNKRKVMQRYDLTAEMYEDRYAEEQKAKYKAALRNLEITDKAVLDVGCGSGLFFSHVTNQASIAVGVDISRKLLLKAKKQTEGLQNVMFLQADADHLPFREALFDAVFSFTVLQNMPKPAETLNEFKRAAKLGARVVVTGLKKAFQLNEFMDVLENSGLKIFAFVNNEGLKCYIATLSF
jgi:malonyl-CoA O-methyltransferase